LNPDVESVSGALVNQNGKSVAPAKKPVVGGPPKSAHAAKATKAARRPPRSSSAASKADKWSANIATAMTSPHLSRSDGTLDAAPASRSATVRPNGRKRPRALARRRPPSRSARRWDRGPRPSKGFGSGRGLELLSGLARRNSQRGSKTIGAWGAFKGFRRKTRPSESIRNDLIRRCLHCYSRSGTGRARFGTAFSPKACLSGRTLGFPNHPRFFR
jgi:hypothetical protein